MTLVSHLPTDLLFLIGLTSSVCVVSEVIKKLERIRNGEKTTDADDFHEVWRTLCLLHKMASWAGGIWFWHFIQGSFIPYKTTLGEQSGLTHMYSSFYKVSWFWRIVQAPTVMLSSTVFSAHRDALVRCFTTVLISMASRIKFIYEILYLFIQWLSWLHDWRDVLWLFLNVIIIIKMILSFKLLSG